MTEDIKRELNREGEPTPFHQALLDHARGLIKMSRCKMSSYYENWDLQDDVYRGVRQPDREDKTEAARGKPVKMIVPHTFAQVMTFTSFLFLMFNQNRTRFELSPTGDADFISTFIEDQLTLHHLLGAKPFTLHNG